MADEIFDVYHDECLEDGYWHVMLLVPRTSRAELLRLLSSARAHAATGGGAVGKVRFGKISHNIRATDGTVVVAKSWMSIGVAALQQHKFEAEPPQVVFGKTRKGFPGYHKLERPIAAKLVVFRMLEGLSPLEYFEHDPMRSVETTLRIGLKGGVNYLSTQGSPISIGNIFVDGDAHHIRKHGRSFDSSFIIGRLANDPLFRGRFTDGAKIIPQDSDHGVVGVDEVDDSYLLQLADLMLGGVRSNSVGLPPKSVRRAVVAPCASLFEGRHDAHPARMRQSRFFGGFCLREASIDGESWEFAPVGHQEPPPQGSLFT